MKDQVGSTANDLTFIVPLYFIDRLMRLLYNNFWESISTAGDGSSSWAYLKDRMATNGQRERNLIEAVATVTWSSWKCLIRLIVKLFIKCKLIQNRSEHNHNKRLMTSSLDHFQGILLYFDATNLLWTFSTFSSQWSAAKSHTVGWCHPH